MKPENMTILTVDDTTANTRLLTHYLEKQGYRVLAAEDGFEGFKAAIQFHPDLVLLDVMMPGTDGYEVCELLKAEEETKDIPVVFLTAKADVEDRVKGFELGAVDYITKPFNLVEIAARVKTHLQLKYYQKLHVRTQKILLQTCRTTSLGKISETVSSHLGVEFAELKKAVNGHSTSSERSQRLQRITETIAKWQAFLDLSRYENESIPIVDLLNDISELVQHANHGKLQIDFQKPSGSPAVFGNYGLLHQAFLDLMLNAAEAGNHIRILTAEEALPEEFKIELRSEPAERYVRTEIKDSGHKKNEWSFDSNSGLVMSPKKINETALRISAAQKIVQDHLGLLKWQLKEDHSGTVLTYLPTSK